MNDPQSHHPDLGLGIEYGDAPRSVDQRDRALPRRIHCLAKPDDGGNPPRARHDRRVGGAAAEIGRQS